MSLVIGMKLPTVKSVLVIGDTRSCNDTNIMAPEEKVFRIGRFILGAVGTTADRYAFLYGLPADTDLTDPVFVMNRIALAVTPVREALKVGHITPGQEEFSIDLLIADGRALCEANQNGHIWPVGNFAALGSGARVARYLLHKHYHPGLTQDEAVALGTMIITEVALVDTAVAPPATWMVTDGR
mgnify:CR=1 FL=1